MVKIRKHNLDALIYYTKCIYSIQYTVHASNLEVYNITNKYKYVLEREKFRMY